MVTYTEVYNNNMGIKDISASRYYYLSVCKECKHKRVRNKNKYNFMKYYQKSHYEYIVYNTNNI